MHALLESTHFINSTLELDELLQIIVQEINRNLNADRSTLYLVDKQKNEIWSKVLLGDESLFIRQAIGKGISGHVAKIGKVVNIDDVYTDERFNPEVDRKSGYRTRSMVCAPVNDKNGEIIGVIQTINKKTGTFDSNDIQFLLALADSIAIAIENARLYQEALERKRLEDEMNLAGEICHFLLPQSVPRIDGYDIFNFHQPSKQVGGDYYDFFVYPEKLFFVLADVSGKGVPAALLMANLHAAFHTLCRKDSNCTDLVKKINKHLHLFTAPDKFATLFLGKLEYLSHSLEYINCGHIPPFLFRSGAKNSEPFLLQEGGIPLGFLDGFNFQTGRINIANGDLLIICSDGITEAMNKQGKMFDEERVVKFFQKSALNKSLEPLGKNFIDKVLRFSKEGIYNDDITLQLIRRNDKKDQ
jgi:sigma-B regulation protein RsbU (phosphoserine phosphatase)